MIEILIMCPCVNLLLPDKFSISRSGPQAIAHFIYDKSGPVAVTYLRVNLRLEKSLQLLMSY